MVKTAILTSEYAEVQKAFERGGKQYYYLNLLPKEDGDMTICLQSLLDHEPTEEDKTEVLTAYAEIVRRALLQQIALYDQSAEVNTFTIDGNSGWWDKATRVGLANSVAAEQAAGESSTTLYLGDHAILCTIDQAKELLQQIELYAVKCYRQTETHRAAVAALTDAAALEAYDYRAGYPAPLTLTTTPLSADGE